MLSLVMATSVFATQLQAADHPENLSGEVALNGSRTTGNTETTDIGGALKLDWTGFGWRQKFRASADYGEQSDVESKNRFRLGYQLGRDLTDRLYAYANADYFQDEFGPYKNGAFLGGGLGYNLILDGPVVWDVEAGPGYRRQKTREPINVGPASIIEEELAGRAFSDISWEVNENVRLTNATELITSSSDTYIWNDIAVTADMFGDLAVRASYRIDYHTDVPLGRENTDTITRLGVVYKID